MHITIKILTIFLFSVLVSCGSPEGRTENDGNTVDTIQAKTSAEEDLEEEEDYLVSAHYNSQLQIELGTVANEKSSTKELQDFAHRVTEGNRIIQNNITELATAAGIEMTPALTPEYSALIESVRLYSGAKFDSAFLQLVIEEHDEDIQRFSELSTKTQNPIVRDLLTNNLEILQTQKNQAEELKSSLED